MGLLHKRHLYAAAGFFAFLLPLTVPLNAPAGPRADSAPQRVVAIGDIHGDLPSFTAILRQAGITDARNRWVAQNVTLVQTGDAVDRGPYSRQVLDRLMDLEKQAPKKNSRLVALLGNHEVMNILGDLRYVTPPEFAAFADSKSEKRRQSAWKQYVEWSKERAKALGKPDPVLAEAPDAAWLDAHPPGFFEHRDAYSPAGKYGKWLRLHDTVARVGSTLFLHGGLSLELPAASIEEVNRRVQAEVKLFDDYVQYLSGKRLTLPFFTLEEMATAVQEEFAAQRAAIAAKSAAATAEGKAYQPSAAEKQDLGYLEKFLEFPTWWSINPDGPLWFRGYVRWTDEEGAPLIEKILARFGASALVVGHSPLKSARILPRFGGRVFLIDTGMLSSYYEGGRASALEISGNIYTAVYMDARSVLHPAPAAQPAATPAPAPNVRPADQLRPEEPGGGLAPNPARPARQRPAKVGSPPKASSESAAASPKRIWTGPDGNALPFRNDEEVREFLRTARVVSSKEIGSGSTHPKKLLLEKDGVRVDAIFRAINVEKTAARMSDGRIVRDFRDSYVFEIAAYELSQLLGLDAIPPATDRDVEGKHGSVQVWIEKAMSETDRMKQKATPPDVRRWNHQLQTMRLFDLLIYNWDRHTNNILIDANWKLWMVDHTRSFRRELDTPYLDQIILCDRAVWQGLQRVDDQAIRQRLGRYLREGELSSLLKRRKKLVEYLTKLIADRGEKTVLFSR